MVRKTENMAAADGGKTADAANINIPPTIVEDMEALEANKRDNSDDDVLLEDAGRQDVKDNRIIDYDNDDIRFNLEELSSVLEQLENHNVPSYQQRRQNAK